jgi:hypothetical protein
VRNLNVLDVRDTLLSVLDDVYHYEAPASKPDKYIVWGETGVAMRMSADNRTRYAAVSGEILYYTRDEYDTTADAITNAFAAVGIVCNLTAIGFDYEIGQTVYTYDFEVSCGSCNLYA